MNYMYAAGGLGDPGPITDHQELRLGLVAPMRLAQELFGFSQAAYHIVPAMASLLLVFATYLVGRLLVGRILGVAAGLAVIGNSIVIVDTSAPLPDILAAALVTSAVGLALALHQHRHFVASSFRRRVVTLGGMGVLLGWGYLTREFSIFVWPLVLALLWRRIALRELVWLIVPIVGCFAVEIVYGGLVYGDPLARVKAVAGHGNGPITPELAATYQNKPRTEYMTRLPDALLLEAPWDPWLRNSVWFSLGAGLLFWRRLWPLLLWGFLVWIPLTLLGGVLDPSEPMLRIQKLRYWYPMFPALVLGSLGGVWLFGTSVVKNIGRISPTHRTRRVLEYVAPVVASVLVFGSVWVVVGRTYDALPPSAVASGRHDMEALRAWFTADGEHIDQVWADRRLARFLPIFQVDRFGAERWDAEIIVWKAGARPPGPDDYVVLVSPSSNMCGWCRIQTEMLLGKPVRVPEGWRLVFATRDNEVQVWRTSS